MNLRGLWNLKLNNIENEKDHFFEIVDISKPFSNTLKSL